MLDEKINEDAVGADEPDSATLRVDKSAKKEKGKLFGDKLRYEAVQNAFKSAFIILLWVVLIGFILVFAIRVLHLVLPENDAAHAGSNYPHGWLTTEQLASIDRYFFSGAAGSAVTWYLGGLGMGKQKPAAPQV